MPFSTISRRAFSMRARRSSSEIGTMPSVIGRSARIDAETSAAASLPADCPPGRSVPLWVPGAFAVHAAAPIPAPAAADHLRNVLRGVRMWGSP